MRRTKYSYMGTSASRPTLTPDDVGFEFYDITLKKPIWWDGENWTDALGTVLAETTTSLLPK